MLTYCAFFDKSTKFGTVVVQPIMNKFGYWAITKVPSGGRGDQDGGQFNLDTSFSHILRTV